MRFQDVRIGFLIGSLFLFGGSALAQSASETIIKNTSADEQSGGVWGAQPTLGDVTNNGAFSYRYPIDVPAFRGLEPKLSLTYNSSRKTRNGGDYQGWLGYGWGLSGVPVIERAGYALGVRAEAEARRREPVQEVIGKRVLPAAAADRRHRHRARYR